MFVTSVVVMRVCGGACQSSLSEEKKCEGGPLGQRELLGRLPTQEGMNLTSFFVPVLWKRDLHRREASGIPSCRDTRLSHLKSSLL